MKITVFTSNRPRHISLVEKLTKEFTDVTAVIESSTLFPGKGQGVFSKSAVIDGYFAKVRDAEAEVFGPPRFLKTTAALMLLNLGDLNSLDQKLLAPALDADAFIVFGASFIKGWLCEYLESKSCFNIHMGVSPYYRGNSCNFWALYDGSPQYVGATIHKLTKGLDSGPIAFHAFPKAQAVDPFVLGMKAVQSAHDGLISRLKSGEIFKLSLLHVNGDLQVRYSKALDFNDDVASRYLQKAPKPDEIYSFLKTFDYSGFVRPYIG